jgi:Cu-Zn family superoxide dismutase
MNNRSSWRYAVLAGAAMLAAACGPGDSGTGADRRGAATESGRDQPPAAGTPREAASANRETPGARPTTPNTATPPGTPGAAGAPGDATAQVVARADVRPLGDNTVRGTIEFLGVRESTGPIAINVMLMGLAAGPHGIHVHVGTDCAMPGQHFNPQNSQHGAPTASAEARHRGDLGNITADASGVVQETLRDSMLGADRDFIGKVIVVHTAQDDLTSQPDGASGEPLACGVIEPGDTNVSQSPGQDRGV